METDPFRHTTISNCMFTTSPSKEAVKTFNRLLDVIQEQNKLLSKIAEGLRGGDINAPMLDLRSYGKDG